MNASSPRNAAGRRRPAPLGGLHCARAFSGKLQGPRGFSRWSLIRYTLHLVIEAHKDLATLYRASLRQALTLSRKHLKGQRGTGISLRGALKVQRPRNGLLFSCLSAGSPLRAGADGCSLRYVLHTVPSRLLVIALCVFVLAFCF